MRAAGTSVLPYGVAIVVEVMEQRVGLLGERLRVSVLTGLTLLLVVLAGGQLGLGVSGVVTLLVIAGVAAAAALLPLLLAWGVRAGGLALVGLGAVPPPLPRVSAPDAAGHARPRAPDGAAAR